MILSKQTQELLFTRDPEALNQFLLTELKSLDKMHQAGKNVSLSLRFNFSRLFLSHFLSNIFNY